MTATSGVPWMSSLLLSAGAVGVLLAFGEGASWGWGPPVTYGVGLLGVALVVGWVLRERRTSNPLINVQHLLRREVRVPYVITASRKGVSRPTPLVEPVTNACGKVLPRRSRTQGGSCPPATMSA